MIRQRLSSEEKCRQQSLMPALKTQLEQSISTFNLLSVNITEYIEQDLVLVRYSDKDSPFIAERSALLGQK